MKYAPLKNSIIITLTIMFLASGCSIFKGNVDIIDIAPQKLAEEGMKALNKKRYSLAVEIFQKIRDHHPYSKYAILAELKQADAYYGQKEYELAAEAYQEFENLHPKNEAAPYALFRQGMSYVKQRKTIDRDQSAALIANQTMTRLIQRYPNSEYVPNAKKRIAEGKELLAGHEFYIGEFYFSKKRYKAALGRLAALTKKYPETTYAAKAKPLIEISKKNINQKLEIEKKAEEEKKKSGSRLLDKD